MPTLRYSLAVFVVFSLSWLPWSFEYTLASYSIGKFSVMKMLDIVFFVPFALAFASGVFFGYSIIWRVVIASTIIALLALVVSIYDLNTVQGGWNAYGDIYSELLVVIVMVGGTVTATFIGSLANKLFIK